MAVDVVASPTVVAVTPFPEGHDQDVVLSQTGTEISAFASPVESPQAPARLAWTAPWDSVQVVRVGELEIMPGELEKGAAEELEHTEDLHEARKIALDHLAERPDYYEVLEACMAKNGGSWDAWYVGDEWIAIPRGFDHEVMASRMLDIKDPSAAFAALVYLGATAQQGTRFQFVRGTKSFLRIVQARVTEILETDPGFEPPFWVLEWGQEQVTTVETDTESLLRAESLAELS
jgi:hypothetical protein